MTLPIIYVTVFSTVKHKILTAKNCDEFFTIRQKFTAQNFPLTTICKADQIHQIFSCQNFLTPIYQYSSHQNFAKQVLWQTALLQAYQSFVF